MTPPKKQTLFFSATMPPEITRLTKQFLKDPVRIEATRPATTATTITQHLVRIPSTEPKAKRMALRALINKEEVRNGIVFCNRKSEVDIVAKSLKKHGFDAGAIHGDLDQATRMRTLDSFRNGGLKLLCASDVAARGLDIPDVSHVFNFDVPHHADDYVHRIGRTGRAGRTGEAFMIVTPADAKNIDKVLKLIGKTPEEVTIDGVDFAAIKDERRASGRDRDRNRGGRTGDRGRERARPIAPHGEVAAMEPLVPPPAEDEAHKRKPARARREAEQPSPSPRPAPTPASAPAPAVAPEPRRGGRRADGDKDVVGFGADVPAFLLRRAPLPPSGE